MEHIDTQFPLKLNPNDVFRHSLEIAVARIRSRIKWNAPHNRNGNRGPNRTNAIEWLYVRQPLVTV